MAYPVHVPVTYSFTDFETQFPTKPKPGVELDKSFTNVINGINSVLDALTVIQRDDFQLTNGIVTFESLAPELYDQIIADISIQIDLSGDVAAAEAAAAEAKVSATDAHASAQAAAASQSTASGAATTATAAANQAIAAEDQAQTYADAAHNSATEAANSDQHATQSAASASISEQSAHRWAEYLPGPVPGTAEYSSHWWAVYAARVVSAGGVSSFNNRVGDVLPMEGDYSLDQLSDVNTANALDGMILARAGGIWVPQDATTIITAHGVASFKGRTGAVIPAPNDYAISLLSDVDLSAVADGDVLLYSGGKWVATPPAALGGDVKGPASSTDLHLASFSGTTGKLIQDSGKSPTDFAPTVHTHVIADVTGLQATLDNKARLDGDNIFQGSQTTVDTNGEASWQVANYKNIGAVGDHGGYFESYADNNIGDQKRQGTISWVWTNVIAAAEAATLNVRNILAGVDTLVLRIGGGIFTPNAVGGDKGLDTINAKHLYVDGVAVPVIGANDFLAPQTILVDDAVTNVSTDILTISHTTSGLAAPGFGSRIRFNLENAAGTLVNYAANITALWDVATAGVENARLNFNTMIAGVNTTRVMIASGLYTPNAVGGDKGPDTINVKGLYVDGVPVGSGATLGANTFTGNQDISTPTGNGIFSVTNTKAVGAVNDNGGFFTSNGKTAAGTLRQHGNMAWYWSNVSAGVEATVWRLVNLVAGSATEVFKAGAGVYTPSAIGGDMGLDTINSKRLYQDGVQAAVLGFNRFTADQEINKAGYAGLNFVNNTVVGANGNGAMNIGGYASNASSVQKQISYIISYLSSAVANVEYGILQFGTMVAGTMTDRFAIGAGFFATTAVGGDKGAGSINAKAYYVDGVPLPTTAGAPLPTTAGTVGQWLKHSGTTGSGGTWAWFTIGWNNTYGGAPGMLTGVNAGGTPISAGGGQANTGFCWRIT